MHPTNITTEKVTTYALLDILRNMQDALGSCVFGYAPSGAMALDLMIWYLKALVGLHASLFELMKAAERATIMSRILNRREGFSIKDDNLPHRL